MRFFLSLSTLAASLVAFVVAGNLEVRHGSAFSKRHGQARVVRELNSRGNQSLTNEVGVLGARDLEKRFEGVRFTFYDVGLGACGVTNSNSDFIVALNAAQYGSGGYCFQSITITINGKTGTAQIMDECMSCPYGGLDLSRGLFDYFASESAGVLTGSWNFGSAPTTTTSTYIPPTTTSTPPPTTTSTTSTLTSSSSVVSSFSSYSSSSSAANASPSDTTASFVDGVLEEINLAFVGLGGVILAAQGKLD